MMVDFFFKDSLENPKYSFLHKKSPGANKYELKQNMNTNKNVHYSLIHKYLKTKHSSFFTTVDERKLVASHVSQIL